jgi:hypothetical protein
MPTTSSPYTSSLVALSPHDPRRSTAVLMRPSWMADAVGTGVGWSGAAEVG